MFQVSREENVLIINGDINAVISNLKMADWGWKTSWGMAPDGTQVLEVNGHYLRDNGNKARIEIRPHNGVQTKLVIEAMIGERVEKARAKSPLANTSLMRNIMGPDKNLGLKRFRRAVGDKAYESLTKKLY
jgi:hypothetical protein